MYSPVTRWFTYKWFTDNGLYTGKKTFADNRPFLRRIRRSEAGKAIGAMDTVIRNGKLVGPSGIVGAAIGIDKGKIVAIGDEAYLPAGDRTIEAAARFILPGVLDMHCHKDMSEKPPFAPWSRICTTEPQAAALGGVTTMGFYVLPDFEERARAWEANSILDGVFHSIVLDARRKDEMAGDAPRYGITSFKFPVGYKGPQGAGVGYIGIDDGFVFDGFQRAAQLAREGWPAMAMVHAENPDIIPVLRKRVEGRYGVRAWHDSRPNFVEAECMKRMVFLAGVAGCPLYIVHITVREGVDIIKAARCPGQEVIGETCPQYLTHHHDNPTPLMREKPVFTVVNPPIRAREDNERLWEGIKGGVITVIASDTAPNTAALKDVDMWSQGFVPMGLGSNSNMILPVLLSEGVNKRGLSLEKVVEVSSYNPARYFGIYPQKGTISVGSDADMVIVDLDKEVTWSAAMSPSNCDWSIYEGWRFKGWPVLTMVKGEVVMEDGKITGEPGHGRYLPRSKGQ